MALSSAVAWTADLAMAPDSIEARAQGCSTCHGPRGEGTSDTNFPRIAGKPAGYLLNQLKNFRDGQRSYPPMNYLLAYMDDDYMAELAGYFAAQPLDPRHAAPQPPANAAVATATTASPAVTAAGERLTLEGDASHGIPACVLCHGARLTGIQPGIPGLAGLNSRYIAAQLVSWRVGTRHANNPDCMREIATRLSENQIRQVSGWLGSRQATNSTGPAPAGAWATPLPCGSQAAPPAPPSQNIHAVDTPMSRGEYLAHLGDCVACHSKHGGVPFAGGFAMPTPFGTLYSPNITPDKKTGIGTWTATEFYQMLHTGRSRDGTLLYPAMPFPAYTKITREDSDALFKYLRTLKPANQPNHDNELRFPYNNRSLMFGWRVLFFTEGTFQPAPDQSTQFNRGAYLVQGLGHCASCHSPINALGGSSDDAAYAGGLIPLQNWYAPSLTSNLESGLGTWSVADVSALLKGGASMRGAVYGPMAEVTHNSLQYLTGDDATAMSVYLKSLLELRPPATRPAATNVPSATALATGRTIYVNRCAACHRSDGQGMAPAYPPLAGNPSIEMESSVNPLRMVLNGGYPPQTHDNQRPYGMPPFAQIMSDEEVAAVVTYIRVSWGNHGSPVTPHEANAMRIAPLLD
jgi:cytochrome c553